MKFSLHSGSRILALICVCGLMFAACAAKPERISEEELAALREQYPYDDQLSPVGSYSFAHLQQWDLFQQYGIEVSAAAVITLTDDWQMEVVASSPFKGVEPDELPAALALVYGVFHPARIEQLLWGGDGLEIGKSVNLSFGSTIVAPVEMLETTYQAGKRYVALLFDAGENAYGVEDAFGIEKVIDR